MEGFPPLHSAKEGQQPQFVFVRKPVLDILGLLGVQVPGGCWLQGAPGTGKSQTGRLWACLEVCKGKRVTFSEVRDGAYWITTMHDKKWHQVSTDEKSFVEDLKSGLEDGIVVLDGVAWCAETSDHRGLGRIFAETQEHACHQLGTSRPESRSPELSGARMVPEGAAGGGQ
jgi:hypothetical protein